MIMNQSDAGERLSLRRDKQMITWIAAVFVLSIFKALTKYNDF